MKGDFRVYVNGQPYGFLNDQEMPPHIVALPEAPLVPDWPCDQCLTNVPVLMGQQKTYQVNIHGIADETGTCLEFRRFCSARCMAEWLADELAKEESK
jgi:hypothetical protein